jgi:hypothetical protein
MANSRRGMKTALEVPVLKGEVSGDNDLVSCTGPKNGTIIPDSQRNALVATCSSGGEGSADLFDQRKLSGRFRSNGSHFVENKWRVFNSDRV